MQRNRGKQQNGKDYKSLQENCRYQGNISCKGGHNKRQNQQDLTESEDIKKKKCKKKRRKPKGKVQKERYTHLNAECQKIARRDKKAIISDQCKEIENSNRMGRLKISSRKLEITRENFLQRWAQ